MRPALKGRDRDDLDAFLLNGMTAVEQLAKAALCKEHPLLIVDATNQDSLLLALGRTPNTPGVLPRTLALKDCIKRLVALSPEHSGPLGGLTPLAESRNALVHIGARGQLRELDDSVALLRGVEALLRLAATDRDWYYDGWTDYVDAWLHKGVQRDAVVVSARVAAATERWRRLQQMLSDEALKALVVAREAQYDPLVWAGDLEITTFTCPVCQNSCVLDGMAMSEDDDPPLEATSVQALFFPHALSCGVCGLVADDTDQLASLGVPTDLAYRLTIPASYDRSRVYSLDEL